MPTMQEQMEERWNHMVNSPFKPLDAVSQVISPDVKMMHALNYIAAQLGQINANLVKLAEMIDARKDKP